MKAQSTHGCADPKMCPECRHIQVTPASEDPDIRQSWTDLREGLAAMLRPYVQAHIIDGLTRRAIAELLVAPGWKPPLNRVPDDVRQARIDRYMAATEPRDAL